MTNMTNSEKPVHPIESSEILPRLNAYLRLRYALKMNPARIAATNANVIDAKRAAFSLYLRVAKEQMFWPHGPIVIARIFFSKTRQGNGRSLVQFLTAVARELDYKFLGIESPNDNSRAFAASLGFVLDQKYGNLLLRID
jgi:hypothetical protein